MNATQVNASWCDWYMWLFTISLGCHNHCSYMFFHWNFGKFGLLNLPPPPHLALAMCARECARPRNRQCTYFTWPTGDRMSRIAVKLFQPKISKKNTQNLHANSKFQKQNPQTHYLAQSAYKTKTIHQLSSLHWNYLWYSLRTKWFYTRICLSFIHVQSFYIFFLLFTNFITRP